MMSHRRKLLAGTAMTLGAVLAFTAAPALPEAAAASPGVQLADSNPCNPCAANPCNPCAAANPCNPCAAANPCNPCNPCAAD